MQCVISTLNHCQMYIYLYTAFNVLYICVHFACMQTPTIGYMAS